jgi:Fe-S cluster assembly iron-binding protein IscA
MLTLTQEAATVIREIVDANEAVPDEGGLRISSDASTDGTTAQLNLTLVPAPLEDDQEVEVEGAHVFVGPQLVEALDDKVLHAEVAGDEIHFTIEQQT